MKATDKTVAFSLNSDGPGKIFTPLLLQHGDDTLQSVFVACQMEP
jgi:hypothetical protein